MMNIVNFVRVAQIWDWNQEGRRIPAKQINEVYTLIKKDEFLRTRKQKLEFICKYFEDTRDKVINNYYIMKHPEDVLKNPDEKEKDQTKESSTN